MVVGGSRLTTGSGALLLFLPGSGDNNRLQCGAGLAIAQHTIQQVEWIDLEHFGHIDHFQEVEHTFSVLDPLNEAPAALEPRR